MDDKTRFELEALLCEKEGMIAENYYRLSAKLPLKYEEKEFDALAACIRALGGEEKPKTKRVRVGQKGDWSNGVQNTNL